MIANVHGMHRKDPMHLFVELNNGKRASIDDWYEANHDFLVDWVDGTLRRGSCLDETVSMEKPLLKCKDQTIRPLI